ncbi:MAG: threonylcarbamoyl-AMP synthase, partial [Bacteroidales bacterium]|nr:threonylcarbamoyl-AMP synthase [Bacteroidales bacterium]
MKEIVEKSCEILKNSGIILYPTDTIWGIGCDACDEKAIAKIYSIKHRDAGKSMLILVDSIEMAEKYTANIPEIANQLIEAADRPLTIIYPKAKNLPQNLIAADGSIGIRIVNDTFCQEVIKMLGKPLVSTSANVS